MEDITQFTEFPKLARLTRECVITEKLDGTNAQLLIVDRSEVTPEYLANPVGNPFVSVSNSEGDFLLLAGSRTRWISPRNDNYGFAQWVFTNRDALAELGPGRHFGEWWGNGIQRRYGLSEKRFSLFNTARWNETPPPACCSVVPILYQGLFSTQVCDEVLDNLWATGSIAAPGFMDPEGIVCYHVAGNCGFKKTLDNDAIPKSLQS